MKDLSFKWGGFKLDMLKIMTVCKYLHEFQKIYVIPKLINFNLHNHKIQASNQNPRGWAKQPFCQSPDVHLVKSVLSYGPLIWSSHEPINSLVIFFALWLSLLLPLLYFSPSIGNKVHKWNPNSLVNDNTLRTETFCEMLRMDGN